MRSHKSSQRSLGQASFRCCRSAPWAAPEPKRIGTGALPCCGVRIVVLVNEPPIGPDLDGVFALGPTQIVHDVVNRDADDSGASLGSGGRKKTKAHEIRLSYSDVAPTLPDVAIPDVGRREALPFSALSFASGDYPVRWSGSGS